MQRWCTGAQVQVRYGAIQKPTCVAQLITNKHVTCVAQMGMVIISGSHLFSRSIPVNASSSPVTQRGTGAIKEVYVPSTFTLLCFFSPSSFSFQVRKIFFGFYRLSPSFHLGSNECTKIRMEPNQDHLFTLP